MTVNYSTLIGWPNCFDFEHTRHGIYRTDLWCLFFVEKSSRVPDCVAALKMVVFKTRKGFRFSKQQSMCGHTASFGCVGRRSVCSLCCCCCSADAAAGGGGGIYVCCTTLRRAVYLVTCSICCSQILEKERHVSREQMIIHFS